MIHWLVLGCDMLNLMCSLLLFTQLLHIYFVTFFHECDLSASVMPKGVVGAVCISQQQRDMSCVTFLLQCSRIRCSSDIFVTVFKGTGITEIT